MKYFLYIIYIGIFFLFSSCHENLKKDSIEKNDELKLELKYAKGFSIIYNNMYKTVIVKNPWQGASKIQFQYFLVDRLKKIPDAIKQKIIIRTPVEKVICLSTTHVAMIDFIDEVKSLSGVAGSDYIINPGIRKLIDEKKITDIGFDNNLNYEKIISIKPDVVMIYGVGSEASQIVNKLNDLNIPSIVIGEYLEETVLAKFEWVKFIAAFFNKEKLADEKFSANEIEYCNLKILVKNAKQNPKVITGLPWKGTWWIPGANSNMAKLISDAGGDFLWKENQSKESIPVSIESVVEKSVNASVWINPGAANSKAEILSVDERIKKMDVFNKGYIYNNNELQNKFGGNDFWESGVVNPQNILKDLISIFHPEILPDHILIYYKKL